MDALTIRFKKLHPSAVAPSRAHEHDAGWDLTALRRTYEHHSDLFIYETGIAVSIPPGYVGLVFPRSSIRKHDLSLANSVGVIDSGFLGDITLTFRKSSQSAIAYEIGDRIGQLVIIPLPSVQMVECDDLGSSERGVNGHGSTGK